MTDKATLLGVVGGEAGMAALVDRLYDRVLADAKIAAFFAHSDVDELKRHQHDFLMLAVHGDGSYHGRPMREAHAGRGITDRDFDRLMQHLAEAMDDTGIDDATAARLIQRLTALRGEIVGA